MVLAQYYNFIRLGFEGYRAIMEASMENARYLARLGEESEKVRMLVRADKLFMPVLTFESNNPNVMTVFQASEHLRKFGWIVPAYTLPPNAEDVAVLRVVVKENFSRDMAEMLVDHMREAYAEFHGRKPVVHKGKKGTTQRVPC